MNLPSTAELLLEADWRRPRSQQAGMGISDLGGCRRQAGYKLAGYRPEKPSGSVQAVMGTAVHDKVDAELILMRDAGIIPPDSVINEEVWFAGLRGHPDLYVDGILRDTKTLGYDAQLASYRVKGPPRRHVWQVMTYAAAMIVAEHPVHTVQIDYLVRDSGNTWMWEGPFDYDAVREAVQWLAQVREIPLDMLARDFAPDSAMCGHCPFSGPCWDGHVIDRDERSVYLVDNEAEAEHWAQKLMEARERKREAEREEAWAKGVLDAIRPNESGTAVAEIPGFPWMLKWTVIPRRGLDGDQVREDYARAGSEPPTKLSRSVKLELVARPDDD